MELFNPSNASCSLHSLPTPSSAFASASGLAHQLCQRRHLCSVGWPGPLYLLGWKITHLFAKSFFSCVSRLAQQSQNCSCRYSTGARTVGGNERAGKGVDSSGGWRTASTWGSGFVVSSSASLPPSLLQHIPLPTWYRVTPWLQSNCFAATLWTESGLLASPLKNPARYLFLNQTRFSVMIHSTDVVPAQFNGWYDIAWAGTREMPFTAAAETSSYSNTNERCKSGPKRDVCTHRRLLNLNYNILQPSLSSFDSAICV